MDESQVKMVVVVGKYFVFDPEAGKEDGCGDIHAIHKNISRAEAVEAMIFDLPTVNQFVICFHNNTRHFQVKTTNRGPAASPPADASADETPLLLQAHLRSP